MLLSLTGASGAGKSTVLEALRRTRWPKPLALAEFDSVGVPPGADTAWRHSTVERWIRRALELQERGRHLLLCGQVPLGELLAAPSAERLDRIAVCVLDCSADVRRTRLRSRGEPEEALRHHLAFGEWIRSHSVDPTFHPEVIRVPSTVPMRWERWEAWLPGDPRWAPELIDTDGLEPTDVAGRVETWVRGALTGGGATAGE